MYDLGGSQKIEEQLQEVLATEGKTGLKAEGIGGEEWVNGKVERPHKQRKEWVKVERSGYEEGIEEQLAWKRKLVKEIVAS